ncbi:MAG: type II toxin-antitoxin system MqsR family toxin [Azoarcus sp.]|jgi:motility quorum-sensing regulator/GCU-specific mRNA interferase toxin|nr:type II toxin-antitoxin system MqsR family toxin [Azoarcus sp.]
MEKSKPHYFLTEIKAIVARDGMAAFTATARDGVMQLGISSHDALGIIAGLGNAMFYKSMTTHMDHRIWQDVYCAPCPNGRTAYIKFTLRAGTIVIQFKEK